MVDKTLDKINTFIPEKWRWVLLHGGFRKYFKNTGWMFLGQFFYLFLSFFIGAWIARYLGPEKYGIVSYVVAFVGLFAFASSLGVDGVIQRELVSKPEKKNELLGTGFRLKLIGAIAAFFLVVLASVIFASDNILVQVLIIVFSLNFFLQAPSIISNFFYAQVKAKKPIQAQIFTTLISSVLKIALILFGGGIIWLIVIYILDVIWTSLFLVYLYKREGYKISAWKYDKMVAKFLWKDSWPLMLSAAAATIYLRIDQVMVGQILGEMAVGIYAAGVKMTEIFYFIPVIIASSLFPAIVNARKTNINIYLSRLKNLYLLLGVLALLIAIPISIFSELIVNLVFGPDYLASASILRLYVWSSIGFFIASGIGNKLMAENRTQAIFGVNLASMIINIVLNLYLIPMLGLIGAALATLLSYSAMPFWLFLIDRQRSAQKF